MNEPLTKLERKVKPFATCLLLFMAEALLVMTFLQNIPHLVVTHL